MDLSRRGLLHFGGASCGAIAISAHAAQRFEGASILDLRVCGLTEPLALGARQPRFSWRLGGPDRNRQIAYRVTVACSQADLTARRNLLWDSGRVASSATFDIPYQGPAPVARTRLWWRVEVWGERGAALTRVSFWETGLVAPADWTADWLACESETAELDRKAGLHWIGAASLPHVGAPVYFRGLIVAERAGPAELLVSANRLDGVWLNGTPLKAEGDKPVSWTSMATYPVQLAAGRNVVAVEVTRIAAYGAPPSVLAAIVRVTDSDGSSRRITSASGWKAGVAADPAWRDPAFDDHAWEAAVEATSKPIGEPWPKYPAILLRRELRLDRPIRSARLYATALGCYEAWINGQRVGDRRMAPESTDTSRRVLYQAYDVTPLLKAGDNALGLWVGEGWYGSAFSSGSRFSFGPAPCRVLAQLEVTYEDGTAETFGTGPGWSTATSAILTSEIYDGEIYDARLEQDGWASPGFSGSRWRAAYAAPRPPVAIEPQQCPPVRVTQTLPAAHVTEPKPGVHVFDFGQNFAGWVRLRVKGPKGSRIEMRFAEILKASGEADQSNLRTAFARDTYFLRGEGEEVWEPRFTYHGFRYVEVHGLPSPPTETTLLGLVAHNDLTVTGALRVGDAGIQQFWRNSVWSQRSNFFGLPTDCSQRDERLGWMGDAEVFWPAAAFNMDTQAYTSRVMGDVRHEQSDAGGFPDVVPPFISGHSMSSPGWADAGVILPYTSWRQYGDTEVVAANWDAMQRYLAWLERNNPNFLWLKGRGADYGDWLAVDAKYLGEATTPKDLIATAYWASDASMMAEMAEAIGRPEDAARYRNLFDQIRSAFRTAYVKPNGEVGNASQTSYVLAIRFGLLTAAGRAEAGRRLAADIAGRGGTLSTGFLGTPHILDALADTGQQETAVSLLLQRRYPSWGYMVEKGATTMWERWNSDTGDVAMNSYNHYAFGAITSFLFRRIAGVAPAEPGFRRVRIEPIFDRRLGRGGADYEAVVGRIRTDWRIEGSEILIDVGLPAAVTGDVVLPEAASRVRLNGRPLDDFRRRGERGTIRLQGGDHRLAASV